ncbi:hypothetical protein ACHQM5_026134 [Ranunculus cassubicifolius]
MPLPKYYCDYCDKQFQDTPSARKRHLQGLQHQRSKSLYYDSFKAPNQIQIDNLGRGICNHFMRTGFCQYGDSCKYIHPKQNIQSPNMQVQNLVVSGQSSAAMRNQLISEDFMQEDVIRDGTRVSSGNLPPSLRPPPEGGYPSLPSVDWG